MKTAELERLLACGVAPVDRPRLARRRTALLALAASAALALTGGVLGWNPALAAALRAPMFWGKEVFALALAAAATLLALRLARPGRVPGGAPLLAGLPVLVLWGTAAIALAQAPASERAALLLGRTALVCPWLIGLVSLPLLLAWLVLLRGLAPTRPRLAAAAAGLAAGAGGAAAYAWHCPELAAPFVAVWYVLGALLPALLGAALAPRWLRW
jgi:hypothetical protein